MNIAQVIPLADTWGMHGDVGTGWMVVMVLFWGVIILGAVWLIRSAFYGRSERRESPTEVLERRLAEGAITLEEYRARRETLANGTSRPNGADEDEPLTAARAGEGRQ